MRPRIWIDTDLALGAARGDVDDGFAIAAVAGAARLGLADWLGLSVVDGNTDARTALEAARRLVAVSGLDVPVVPRAEAVDAIAALPSGVRLLSIGPPIHVVAAARRRPGLAAGLELWGVGGVLAPRRHPILTRLDLNLRWDPEATRTLLRLPLAARRLVPLDVARRLVATPARLAGLERQGRLAAHLARHARRWQWQAALRYGGLAFPVWDLVAALGALDRLPGARIEGERLVDFDPERAWDSFVRLLDPRAARLEGRAGALLS